MSDFQFNNNTKYKVRPLILKKVSHIFFKVAKLGYEAEYSLAFVKAKDIKKLNKIYRNKDSVTDVLSFAEEDDFIEAQKDKKYLGEILICPTKAKDQAKEYGWNFEKEIIRLLIHGLSHLIGYDHENVSKKKAEEMFSFEKKLMIAVDKILNCK